MPKCYAILVDFQSSIDHLASQILKGEPKMYFGYLSDKNGGVFSNSEIERFIWEEEHHDIQKLETDRSQSIKSMSSGERKRVLLENVLAQSPEFLVLVNPFDNLDSTFQRTLRERLLKIAQAIPIVQLVNRLNDILPNTDYFFAYGSKRQLIPFPNQMALANSILKNEITNWEQRIPTSTDTSKKYNGKALVVFKNVSVSYNGCPVLDGITWTIKQGDFWELVGPNGSGKTTLLTLITGDNHKGYGQDLTLFGQKKGSGESVWDIKESIGYFTPSLIDQFSGYHSALDMVISGFHDSVGLYQKPSDAEIRTATAWLQLLNLGTKTKLLFKTLTRGEKRLIMLARAMIKHPSLLILDEPTAGLDDKNARIFIALVNKISVESSTAIIFVSHRKELGLSPKATFSLEPKKTGSVGKVTLSLS
ncbi:MAG: ATP-binding cassette domain-containing protein [Bacteroidota bacterium]